ncbi:uncharacterized protein KGF55_001353 [Candida pseudojiufengensis]|uniref:uncharacterized protein n=1 Tax=Candida pseudojiufengensis TaxID=497109 RepID=UPI00222586C3|nr:uncharacterized protein KGF55_001353 [Candida pseudojiufengensis]KAI5965133.1 hypothetical protein KGF55_001353 [Candida pseudojiufengensis]
MSSVPILTIPESSFDPSVYNLRSPRSKSELLIYLIKLTHGASLSLIITYAIGLFILKPLLETRNIRRLDLLECIRTNLRDLYLKTITKISYIPIVAIRRNGKLYSDAIIQTESSNNVEEEDKLGQTQLHLKLKKMSNLLNENVRTYKMSDLTNYKSVNFAIKDLQNKSDLVYFDDNEIFMLDLGIDEFGKKVKKRNIVVDTKNEIRSIKGLYMSGQV